MEKSNSMIFTEENMDMLTRLQKQHPEVFSKLKHTLNVLISEHWYNNDPSGDVLGAISDFIMSENVMGGLHIVEKSDLEVFKNQLKEEVQYADGATDASIIVEKKAEDFLDDVIENGRMRGYSQYATDTYFMTHITQRLVELKESLYYTYKNMDTKDIDFLPSEDYDDEELPF